MKNIINRAHQKKLKNLSHLIRILGNQEEIQPMMLFFNRMLLNTFLKMIFLIKLTSFGSRVTKKWKDLKEYG